MITLTGTPRSTQNCYRTSFRGGYMIQACKDLKIDYQWQAQSQWKKKVTKSKLNIEVRIFFGDKRVHDIDNFNKLWMDSLTDIVYVDDSQIEKLTIWKDYDKTHPRIEIKIT